MAKILLLVHQYPPHYVGGTELYTRALAHALVQRGHHATVFYRDTAPGGGLEKREEEGVAVWRAWSGQPSPSRRFLAAFGDAPLQQAFERVLNQESPDRVHVQHLLGLPIALLDLIRKYRIPFAVTLHDYWWVCANAQLLTNYSGQICKGPHAYLNCARCALARARLGKLWPAVPVLAPLMAWRTRRLRSALLAADTLIAPSSFVKEWYNTHGLPNRIEVLPHGLEWPPRLAHERPTGAPVRLAYIGGLSWQKGVHILMEAFQYLKGAAELWIAGDESFDAPYADRLRAHASPQVRFFGRLSHPEVWVMLSQVDVVAVPSLWPETFSLIAHEAFAAGLPVIASRIGALTEAVHDGENGLLLPPGDVHAWQVALQRLVDEPGLLARMRSNVHPPSTLESHVRRLETLLRL